MVKRWNTYTVLFILFIAINNIKAQEQYYMSLGNVAYVDSNFVSADSLYELGAELNYTDALRFNRGLAAYNSDDADKAQQLWSEISDPEIEKDALFNKATAYLQQGDLDQAIDGYKSLLRRYPDHRDAQHNLSIALSAQSQQQQQQQEQGDQSQEGSEDQNQEDQQEQDSEDQQQNESDGEQQEPQDSESEGNQEEEGQSEEGESDEDPESPQENQAPRPGEETQGEPQDVTQAELLQLLKILENEDKKVQRKVQGTEGTGKPRDKDW